MSTVVVAKRATGKTRIKAHVVYKSDDNLHPEAGEGQQLYQWKEYGANDEWEGTWRWGTCFSSYVPKGTFFAIAAEGFSPDCRPESPLVTKAEKVALQALKERALSKLTNEEWEALQGD